MAKCGSRRAAKAVVAVVELEVGPVVSEGRGDESQLSVREEWRREAAEEVGEVMWVMGGKLGEV